MEQKPPSKNKRRLLLGGAGLGGPLVGLLLLATVFGGGDGATVSVAQAPSPRPAQTTTTAAAASVGDEAQLFAALSDPFRQIVTAPDPALAAETGAAPAPDNPSGGGENAGVVAPSSGGSDSVPLGKMALNVGDEAASVDGTGAVPAPSEESVGGETPTTAPTVSTTSTAMTSTTTTPVISDPTTTVRPTTTVPPVTTIPPPAATVPPATTIPPPATTVPPPPATTTTSVVPLRSIAFTSDRDGNQEIYAIEADGRGERRLTDNAGADRDPAWSPDGTRIAFVSERAGRTEIFVMAANGSSPTRVTAHPGWPSRPSWARDGRSIVFESTDAMSANRELFVVNLVDGVVRQLTTGACAGTLTRVCPDGAVAHRQPVFSPDGTKIAYLRIDRTGRNVLVMNADGSGRRNLGGTRALNPAWAPDGLTIAYDDVDGIRAVGVATGAHQVIPGTFRACPPPGVGQCPAFYEPSWSPDGSRLAVRDMSVGASTGDVFVIDLRSQQQTRLNVSARASMPRWFSPSTQISAGP